MGRGCSMQSNTSAREDIVIGLCRWAPTRIRACLALFTRPSNGPRYVREPYSEDSTRCSQSIMLLRGRARNDGVSCQGYNWDANSVHSKMRLERGTDA